jgi:CheY-like chemotaxis protein
MNKRIVILEDDEDTLELFSVIMQAEGYELVLREQLFEDLAEVERLAPALIILDLFMGTPHAGWEFLQHLKAAPATTSIPLILCTAGILTSEQERVLQEQAIPVLFKPFEVEELTHLVSQLLQSFPLPLPQTVQAE